MSFGRETALFLGALALSACADPPSPAERRIAATRRDLQFRGAKQSENAEAVEALTRARCSRETRCGNVGEGEEFESESACIARMRRAWSDDLNAHRCPGGIDPTRLDRCVDAAHEQGCSDPLDDVGRALACRWEGLCQGTPLI